MTAVDVSNDRVVPFFDEHGVELEHMLADNARQYCGRPLQHPYEAFLTISQTQHRRGHIGSPGTTGFCERFSIRFEDDAFVSARLYQAPCP